MGFRSEVALSLSEQASKTLALVLVSDTTPTLANKVMNFFNTAERQTAEGSELYIWKWVKWYDKEEIKFIDGFILNIENGFYGSLTSEDFYFIYIGDNLDDVEIKGGFMNNPFGVHLVRKIAIDPTFSSESFG